MIKLCQTIITYSFYALFFLVPLIMTPLNYELFEFNKMLLVYFLTIIITSAWLIKSAISGKFYIRRTPLDIPIVLFVLSQVLSVLFSIDPHISIFGYYGRFNGGLLSTLSYIILYYAFVSNFAYKSYKSYTTHKSYKKLLLISLSSGFLVSSYALLQKLGIDKNIWVQDVQARPFSTLGQPNWLAAYLAILLPIAMAFSLSKEKSTNKKTILRNYLPRRQAGDRTILRKLGKKIKNIAISKYLNIEPLYFRSAFYIGLSLLFYSVLLLTKSRSGFLAFWLVNGAFWFFVYKSYRSYKTYKSYFLRFFLIFNFSFLLITFIIGSPFPQLNRFFSPTSLTSPSQPLGPALETGGTESGEIRKIVWQGALEATKAKPIFGFGVETFAWIHYKFKPVEHNLTSEWDFLYNKAHNEYLNYAATTGLAGLGSYLLVILTFIIWFLKANTRRTILRNYLPRRQAGDITILRKKVKNIAISPACRSLGEGGQYRNIAISNFGFWILSFGLFSAWLSILATNFFGFSVVVTSLYFWLIPAMVFTLKDSSKRAAARWRDESLQGNGKFAKINFLLKKKLGQIFPKRVRLIYNIIKRSGRATPASDSRASLTGGKKLKKAASIILLLLTSYLLLNIAKLWLSDYHFAKAHNLNRAGDYEQAYQEIKKAINLNPGEPLYHDELSIITATLTLSLYPHDPQNPQIPQLIQEAISNSDAAIKTSPQNLNFLKTRTRMFYTLSQLEGESQESGINYLLRALKAILAAQKLAPADAKISYNLALLYEANGQREKAIETLKKTLKLKPNYQDAQEALELFLNP